MDPPLPVVTVPTYRNWFDGSLVGQGKTEVSPIGITLSKPLGVYPAMRSCPELPSMMALDISKLEALEKYKYLGSARTVKPVFAAKFPLVALTEVYPGRAGVTFPVVSTAAVNGLLLLQAALAETSEVELSEYIKIADSFVDALAPIIT